VFRVATPRRTRKSCASFPVILPSAAPRGLTSSNNVVVRWLTVKHPSRFEGTREPEGARLLRGATPEARCLL
jgi:hypothetical protein